MSKCPGKAFFGDFNKQFWRDLFITHQGNGSKMTFVAGATKINLKNFENLVTIG